MATLPGEYPPADAPPPPQAERCGCGVAVVWHWLRGDGRWAALEVRGGMPHYCGRTVTTPMGRYAAAVERESFRPYPGEWRDE